jgi:hypothetical protein
MPDVETASDSVAMKYGGKYCHRISWCSKQLIHIGYLPTTPIALFVWLHSKNEENEKEEK